ncbi:hypothetical protein A3715_06825 [Oleiphilus sp. HI0009]|nr:hypothetical protein A3715_23695 [Oleiphilus sp. HI0009]KZX81709.1 hypothetical protein A3715_06825 [Oleiphilus sp. HI0009]
MHSFHFDRFCNALRALIVIRQKLKRFAFLCVLLKPKAILEVSAKLINALYHKHKTKESI